MLQVAAEFDLDCSLVAGRYTLLRHEPLQEFFPEVQRRGIAIIAAGVYNSGILAGGSKGNAVARTNHYSAPPDSIIRRVEALEAVCERFGVNLATAAAQFVSTHPAVTSVVLGALTVDHVAQNVAAFSARDPGSFLGCLEAGTPHTGRCPGSEHNQPIRLMTQLEQRELGATGVNATALGLGTVPLSGFRGRHFLC